jgi:hypothetical protein
MQGPAAFVVDETPAAANEPVVFLAVECVGFHG